jgi:hypothetical protein
LLSSPGLSQQSCSSNPPFQEIYGCWDDFKPTDGIEAIHAVLVPVNVTLNPNAPRVGMVLMWHWSEAPDGVNRTRLWDPRNVVCENFSCFTILNIDQLISPGSSPLCAGHSFLPNGNLIVTGGVSFSGPELGSTIVLEFDTSTLPLPTWRSAGSMLDIVDPNENPPLRGGRYYPSTLTIKTPFTATERVYTFAGRNNVPDPVQTNKTVERSDPGVTAWELWGRDDPIRRYLDGLNVIDWYPRLHVMATGIASGKVFCSSGWDRQSWLYDPTIGPNGNSFTASAISSTYPATAVLLPPAGVGRVMIAGGVEPLLGGGISCNVTNKAAIIDFSSPTPSWVDVGGMSSPRSNLNAVTLPDGQVLFVGGETAYTCIGPPNGMTNCGCASPVYTADLFNPVNSSWRIIPPPVVAQRRPRQYHSTAVLLPDGRVLLAGGDSDWRAGPTTQIYKPGYLFRVPRPTITSSPTTISYGTQFTVNATDAGLNPTVLLMRPGSVTHGFDYEQRSVPLRPVSQTGPALTVMAPANTDVARYEAPSGYYMLFVVSGQGDSQIPSEAQWVQLTDPLTRGFWSTRR